jgi:2-dehydropantoate 2-reductase
VNAFVIGSGAVGSLLAWALAIGQISVTLVRRRAARTERTSLLVVGPGRSRGSAEVTVSPAAESADVEPDVVVIAVRTFDVRAAVESLPALPRASFLVVQNGVGSEELVRELRPTNPVVAASLTAAVDLAADGSVHWLRRGGIGLAAVDGDAPGRIADLAAAFDRSGLHARTYRDWRAMKWSKLVANLVGNATSALVDMAVTDVYAHPGLFEVERQQLHEAFGVLRAMGLKPVSLPGADVSRLELAIGLPSPVGRTILGFAVGGGRGGKDPSLRLALAGGAEQTEVGWLNGAVVRAADAAGLQAPVNRALTELVTRAATDPGLRDKLRGKPDDLVQAIARFRQRNADRPIDRLAAG